MTTQNDAALTRLKALDWGGVETQIGNQGFALTGKLLSAADCRALTAAYDDAYLFRSRVVMHHHGYGQGEYQYFT